MRCPACQTEVAETDWFCGACGAELKEAEAIQAMLDAVPLADVDVTDTIADLDDDTHETTDGSGEALILGELPEDGVSLLEVDTFAGRVTDGDGNTSSYLLYANQASTRALQPDARPRRTGRRLSSSLTPLEHQLFRRVDGDNTVAALASTDLASDREVTFALLVLIDRGLITLEPEAAATPSPEPPELGSGDGWNLIEPAPEPEPPVLDAALLTELAAPPAPAVRSSPELKAAARRLFEAAIKDRDSGNLDSARRSLELAVGLSPDGSDAQALLHALEAAQSPQEAPAEPRDAEARRLYHEAGGYEARGAHDAAIARLRAALEGREEPVVLNRLAVILALRKRELVEARALLERAVELAPENRAYVHNLSKVLDFLAREGPPLAEPAKASLWQRLRGKR